MKFPSWLKPVGKVAAEAGKAAGQAALYSNPQVALAVQMAQALVASQGSLTLESVKTLNMILVPQGFMVVAIPKLGDAPAS